jgi:arylsulfatase A-like enzyme
MFRGTWLLAAWTAFRPLAVSYAMPAIAIGAALALAATARPAVLALTAAARRLERRWQRGGSRRALLAPQRALAATAILAAGTAYALWRGLVRPQLGPLDLSALYAPAAAVAIAIAAHGAAPAPLAARRAVAATASLLAVVAAAIALGSAWLRPARVLAVWGAQPVAGLAIELVAGLDALRDRIDLAAFRPAARPGAAHPDLVLITIDTVRADRTPVHGGPAQMPALRALGERGAVFDRAFAPSTVTRRSIPAMVLGIHPHRVRGRVVGWALRVDPRHVLLAERLRAGGYDTAGFMCCASFWGPERPTGLQRGLAHLEIDRDGARLAQRARAWLAAREARGARAPAFVWMHLIEPHNWPAGAPEPASASERRQRYDAALARADAVLADVVSAWAHRPAAAAPIVAVTADHGEGLGDHGTPYHSIDLYNSTLHVPWVIAGPGIPAVRVPEVVSLTDLTPTLLELAGFEPPAGLDGRSHADLARGRRRGDPAGGHAFAALVRDRSSRGGLAALVRGPWKLIDRDGQLELYDLRVDFGERVSLTASRPEVVAELAPLLRELIAAGQRSPFD